MTATRKWSLPTVIAALGAAAAALLVVQSFMGAESAADALTLRTWALVIFAVSLFATHALPEHITALLVLLLAIVGGVAPASVVFSGFEVGALWLLFSGIIVGIAAQEAGLGAWVAWYILGRMRMTYVRAVVLLVVVSVLLGFVIPATIPRIILLMPIALGIAEALGFKAGSRGYTGIALAAGVGTFGPTFAIVTANLPTVVHMGAIESVYGLKVSYAEFLFYHFPVIGVLRGIALVAFLILLFREPERIADEKPLEPMNARQKKLLAVLLGALVMWVTDSWHGIHPAWIAMGAAIVIMWPGLKLISPTAFKEKVDLSPVLYVAGILSIGAIMVANGLDKEVGKIVLSAVDWSSHGTLADLYFIGVLSILVSLISTVPAVPTLLVPIADQISTATGLSLSAVLMTELLGFSTTLLPYQAPPLVVLLSLCAVKAVDLVKLNVLLAIVMLTLGFPAAMAWWQAIGLL